MTGRPRTGARRQSGLCHHGDDRGDYGDDQSMPGPAARLASGRPVEPEPWVATLLMGHSPTSGLRLPVTRQGHLRTEPATCRRPSPTATPASSARLRRKSVPLRRLERSGRGSSAPRGRGCTWPRSATPAVGRGRAAGRWTATVRGGPCTPATLLATQPSAGQFPAVLYP